MSVSSAVFFKIFMAALIRIEKSEMNPLTHPFFSIPR